MKYLIEMWNSKLINAQPAVWRTPYLDINHYNLSFTFSLRSGFTFFRGPDQATNVGPIIVKQQSCWRDNYIVFIGKIIMSFARHKFLKFEDEIETIDSK